MNLYFDNIQLHNFLSFADANFDLRDRGYCLVTGKNNFKKDNALSNGSGKSTLFSAINFALTGETIQGVSKNLKNILIDDEDCWVKLTFRVDQDRFCLTRFVTPKSNLLIELNGTDISGKGIRESEAILAEKLPDLNRDLISSVLILGQGLPNKFSAFTPSGRKDLLEKLAKTDFMIDDIKKRLSTRQAELSKELRSYEDSILSYNAQNDLEKNRLAVIEKTLDSHKQIDYDSEISKAQANKANIETALVENSSCISKLSDEVAALKATLATASAEKTARIAEVNSKCDIKYNELCAEERIVKTEQDILLQEINKLKNIKDVCPTCGQKIPGVQKPSTETQETRYGQLEARRLELINQKTACLQKKQSYFAEIDLHFNETVFSDTDKLSKLNINLKQLQDTGTILSSQLESCKNLINKLVYDKENDLKYLTNLANEKSALLDSIKQTSDKINLMLDSKSNIDARIAVDKKIETLIKRDFRGYLLTNVINYLNNKAKEFSKVVFGTEDLNLELSGNALDISYCGKMLDTLSGGEQTRVDLIMQLAIRSMLQTYLNFSSNIIVLDECTDFLDKQSCAAIMRLLEQELDTVESVFIISHHTDELEISIDSTLDIIKNKNGISEIA